MQMADIQAINKEEIENIHAISTWHAKIISQVFSMWTLFSN